MNNTAYGTFNNGPGQPATSLKDIQDTLDKLRGVPPANWLLMAPDGRVWVDPEPTKLASVLLMHIPLGDFL